MAFGLCKSLKCIVCGKNLKTIGQLAFQYCPLEDVQLASNSISFSVDYPFLACDPLIELAAAAGFPSNEFGFNSYSGEQINYAD